MNLTNHMTSLRRGATLIEIAASAVLFMVAMTVSVQVLAWTAAERRDAETRRAVQQALSNVMERFTARPWHEITTEFVASAKLTPAPADAEGAATLNGDVRIDPADPDAKHVRLEVRWRGRAGSPGSTVRLSAWVYRQPGDVR
jgi:Tfp pilus assembly protein PilV